MYGICNHRRYMSIILFCKVIFCYASIMIRNLQKWVKSLMIYFGISGMLFNIFINCKILKNEALKIKLKVFIVHVKFIQGLNLKGLIVLL